MGLFDTIKGWFNIGGVKVKLKEVPTSISKSGGDISGTLELLAKGDKHVLKVTCRLVETETTGSGEDKEEKENTLGELVMNDEFDIKKEEVKTLDFTLNSQIPERLQDKGGVLGTVGKIGAFASSTKIEYHIVAICDVKGTAFDPSAKAKVNVVDS
jgi:hypothetical protein